MEQVGGNGCLQIFIVPRRPILLSEPFWPGAFSQLSHEAVFEHFELQPR